MLRPIFAYTFTSLILLAQVGLPMHFHYCKGALESVSLVFRQACDDDEKAVAAMPACCKKILKQHCQEKNNCCHDKVKVVSQDITSVVPGYIHWSPLLTDFNAQETGTPKSVPSTISPFSYINFVSDSGPPIFILHHALIYYA